MLGQQGAVLGTYIECMAGINIEDILGLTQGLNPQYTMYPITDIGQLAAGCDLIQVTPPFHQNT